jgi:hypothetical protein
MSGKLMNIKILSAEQRRQLVDTQQVYETWRATNEEDKRRFAGSMRWSKRNGTEYLLRKIGKSETSIGPRNKQTEDAYQAFFRGRKENSDRLVGLSARIDEFAPVNIAIGLARVPLIAARILRACDEHGLLGEQLLVVGTNALYAYEVLAGVQVDSGLVASRDIDLLYDARRHMSLAVSGMTTSGLIGLLKKVDASFAPTSPRSFRAVNNAGYLVDLIRPEAKDVFRDRLSKALTNLPEDLEGAAIFGLGWLINSPKVEAIAVDEKGYPVRLVVIDPRAFALHKAWVSNRPDREPLKAMRDLEQARVAGAIATQYLKKTFDAVDLAALPSELRDIAPKLSADMTTATKPSTTPNW